MMAKFKEVIERLGEELDLPLQVDANGYCLLAFEGDLEVQLEEDGNNLLFGIRVGEVVAGKARDALFKRALQFNSLYRPGLGIFAFSRQANQLVLFETLPLTIADGKKAKVILDVLVATGRQWQEAMRRGVTPELP